MTDLKDESQTLILMIIVAKWGFCPLLEAAYTVSECP
jgi:hypothetical protein